MAGLGIGTFNAEDHDTKQRTFENLPEGDYRLEVESTEVKSEEDGDGKVTKSVMSLAILVVEPEELKGRKFFRNINLVNANPIAQKIGREDLAKLCRAIGIPAIEDSDELHFRTFTARLGMGKDSKEKNTDGSPKYAARTEIKLYYYPDEGQVPAAKAAPVAANDNTPAAAPANDSKPAEVAPKAAGARPWGKK